MSDIWLFRRVIWGGGKWDVGAGKKVARAAECILSGTAGDKSIHCTEEEQMKKWDWGASGQQRQCGSHSFKHQLRRGHIFLCTPWISTPIQVCNSNEYWHVCIWFGAFHQSISDIISLSWVSVMAEGRGTSVSHTATHLKLKSSCRWLLSSHWSVFSICCLFILSGDAFSSALVFTAAVISNEQFMTIVFRIFLLLCWHQWFGAAFSAIFIEALFWSLYLEVVIHMNM